MQTFKQENDMSTIADNLTALSSYLVGIRNSLVDKGIIFGDEPLSAFSEMIDTIAIESQLPSKNITVFWNGNSKIPQYDDRQGEIVKNLTCIPTDTTRIIFGKGISLIKDDAFSDDYTNLSAVQIGCSVGGRAFKNCSNLKSITFTGNSVYNIWGEAFMNCSSLKKIEFPSTVKIIRENVCRGCTELTSILLGNEVNTISSGAFYNCTGLLEPIIIPYNVLEISQSAFGNISLTNGIIFKNRYTSDIITDFDNYPFGVNSDIASNVIKGELGDIRPTEVEEEPTT